MNRIIAFLSPQPISPIFRAGGVLEGYNEDLTLTAFCTFVLLLLDVLVVGPRLAEKSRYFALHACMNLIATVSAAPDVYRAFTDPTRAFSGASQSMWANSAVVAMHLYHCIGGFQLSAADIFHHAMFVLILCGLAIPFKQSGGVANNFGCFFLSGLPGGVDYVLLVLVKEGRMHKLTEKYWNRLINVWVRGPAMSVYATLGWVSWWLGNAGTPTPALCVVVALHFFNGNYYSEMAVGTYHRHCVAQASSARKEQ